MSTKSIDKALMDVQKELYEKGGYIEKTGSNPQYKKSKYIPLPKLLTHLTPMLHRQGLLLLQVNHPSITEGGANVETIIRHIESGEQVSSQCTAPPMLQDRYDGDKKKIFMLTPQSFGSSITYCRRYCLETLLAIPTEDDDANSASGYSDKKSPDKPKAIPPEKVLSTVVGEVVKLQPKGGWDKDKVVARLKELGLHGKDKTIISLGSSKVARMIIGEDDE